MMETFSAASHWWCNLHKRWSRYRFMPEILSQADILWWSRLLTRTGASKPWLRISLSCNSRIRHLINYFKGRASTQCEARKESFSSPAFPDRLPEVCDGMDWDPLQ